MRKISLLIAIVLASPLVLGQPADSGLPEPGTAPGDMLYGLEKAQESISLALTFDSETKAEKKLRYADERLAESRHLMESGENQSAARAANRYSELIEQVNTTAQESGSEELQRQVREHIETRQDVLSSLQEKLPEEAVSGLENAISQRPENVSGRPNQSGESQKSAGGFVVTGGASR